MSMRYLVMRATSLAVALGAAGCGTSESNTTTTDPMVEPEQGQVIDLYTYWGNTGDAQAMQTLLDVHRTRHPKDEIINNSAATWDMFTLVANRIAEGNPPDLFSLQSSLVAGYLRDNGANALKPLDEFLATESQAGVLSNLYPQFVAEVTVDGKIYALPLAATRTNLLFYNKHVFASNQLSPPTTMAELVAVCQPLKAAGVTPVGLGFFTLAFQALVAGGMGIDAYYAKTQGTNDETAVRKAVDAFGDVLDHCLDVQALLAGGGDMTIDDDVAEFMNGQSAMLLGPEWIKGGLEQLGWSPGVDFGVTAAPGNAGLFPYVLDTFVIVGGAPHLDGAYSWFDTVASAEGQLAFGKAKNASPARMDVDLSSLDSERQGIIADMKLAKYLYSMDFMAHATWESAARAFAQSRDKEALVQALLTDAAVPSGPQTCGANETASGESCVCREGFARTIATDPCLPTSSSTGDDPGSGCKSSADCVSGDFCDLTVSPAACRKPATGQGTPCATNADCAGFEANYCETMVSKTCLVKDCSPTLNNCSDDYLCCDFSAWSLPALCVSKALSGGKCG